MPALSDIIRRVTLMFSAPGADQTAQQLENVAAAEDRVSASSSTMSRATMSAQSALDRLQRSVDTEYRSQQMLANATGVLSRARGQGLIDAAREAELLDLAKQKYGGLVPEVEHATAAFGLNRMQIMELTHSGRSMIDMLVAGQSPMRALQMEGLRLGQALSMGEGGLMGTLAGLAPLLAGVGVAVGAVVGIFAGLTYELDKSTGKNITFMETIKATGQAIWSDFTSLLGPAVKQVGGWFGQLVDYVTPAVKALGNSIVGNLKLAYDNTLTYWQLLPSAIGDITIRAANGVISGTQNLINGTIDQINNFIAVVNDKLGGLGVKLGTIGHVDLGTGIANPYAGASDKLSGQIASNTYNDLTTDYMGKFYGQVQDFALKDYAADSTAKAAKAAKDNLKAMSDSTKDLTNQTNAFALAANSAFHDLGTTITDAFKQGGNVALNVLNSLIGKIGDMGTALMNSGFNSIINSIFPTSFLGGATGSAPLRLGYQAGVGGGLFGGSIIPGILHDGGIAGADGYGHGRMFPASTWANAPRYHLGIDEVPAILQRGERVIPANQNTSAANGNGGGIVVHNHIDARGAELGVETKIANAQADWGRQQLPALIDRHNVNPYRRGYRQGGLP